MKISIFGLGYVGCVSLGCLANNGYQVIGIDVNPVKIDLINQGKPTIIEKDIDILIKKSFDDDRITATNRINDSIKNSDVSIVCVGTPSMPEGHLNLEYIFNTAREIGEALKGKDKFHIIAIRSTVLPGTNEKYGLIIEEVSGKKRNIDFAVVSNPEFLREGSAVADYYNPPVTVIGTDNDQAYEIMKEIYSKVAGEVVRVDIRVAELIKYVNNSFHALKIVFANEVGNISKKLGIDSHDVMRLFCMDTQLNISPYYFKPGFAYGGSCLPKDLKALQTLAHDFYIDVPVLNNIENSNTLQKEGLLKLIESKRIKNITVLGISFKAGTDDLRYSPILDVIEKLIGKGYNLKLFDKNVNLSKLVGQNRSYIMEKLPHLAKYLVNDPQNAIYESDLIIITNPEKEFELFEIPENKIILDLVRLDKFITHPGYEGICW